MDDTKDVQVTFMEELRKCNKQVRSFDDIPQLLHKISSEQKIRNLLRSCSDKVLLNMSNVQTLRDILDRLRSVAKTNGLRFQLLLDKMPTSCQISGDLFNVEIELDGRENQFKPPIIHDVKVTYSKQMKSCPELVNIIRNGQFLELSKRLKALVQMFPMSMNVQTKTKVYLALQSLETDVAKMSQLYKDSHKDADNIYITMHGLVGLLASPVMGQRYKLHYFLTPYDLLNVSTQTFETVYNEPDSEKGLHAEIRIKSHSSSCVLPIAPLISNNHPVSGSEQPRFSDINQSNSVSLPACYVLDLKPSVLMMQHIALEIEKVTEMPVLEDGHHFQSYLTLNKKPDEVHEVSFDELTQQYNLNLGHLQACVVSEIAFSSPAHLVLILKLLREQAYLNALFQSCIRTKKQKGHHRAVRYFDVSMEIPNKLNVIFQHPLSPKSTAFAEIRLSEKGFQSCNLFAGRNDPLLCRDEYALTILQKSFSLPITMRAIILQTKRSPRQEPDRHRSRPSIYQHRATAPVTKKPPPPPPTPPTSTLPVSQPSVVTSTSVAPAPPLAQLNIPNPPSVPQQRDNIVTESFDSTKKESQHPILTHLLKPSKQPSVAVQPKNHPILLDLLKEEGKTDALQQQQQPRLIQQGTLYQQQHGEIPQHQQLPPPQYGSGHQMPMQYMQQQPQEAMPPPPSYQAPQMKPIFQQQYQQATHFTNQSPMQLDDISGLPSFSPQTVSSQSTTPPLYSVMQSPLTSPSPQPSPMTFTSSPRQPPMNTPQPLPIPSPRHTTTPPMMSPSARKLPLGRRLSRPKTVSMEHGGFELGFTTPPTFDTLAESESNPHMMSLDVFGTGMSPAQNQQSNVPSQAPSPAVTPGLSSHGQRHFSGDRVFTKFSFEPDMMDSDPQRLNSYNRRTSSQLVMTPSPALSTNQDNQDPTFPSNSPASSVDSFQPSFTVSDTKSLFSDVNQTNIVVKSEFPSHSEAPTMDMRNTSVKMEQIDPVESDPFNFDDNKTPQKISMPDSGGSGMDQKRGAVTSSRTSSVSSNSGTEELKSLLSSAGNNYGKVVKSEKLLSTQSGKASVSVGLQRRGSQDFVPANARSTDGSAAGAGKTLVRQNAIGKGSSLMRFQPLQNEVKEKPKKQRSTKDDKGPPKRRGRPPSTDKKEHPVKKKKMEGAADDSEQRGKIVLNVQLNKGTPISSTTKTKPAPSDPPADKSNSNSASTSSAMPGAGTEPRKLDNLDHYPSDLQQYFRDQNDLMAKKKEKKLATGTSSPLTGVAKSSVKSGSQSNAGVASNTSAIRSQLASSKTAGALGGGSNKLGGVVYQKSGPASTQPQPKPAQRVRKNSIKDVIAMLNEKTGQGHAGANLANKRPPASAILPKSNEQTTNLSKPKGVLSSVSKIAVNQQSKASVAPKPSANNKSPGSYSMKQGPTGNRPTVPVKRDKPRPVTPLRDAKGPGVFGVALSNQSSTNPSANKFEKGSMKVKEAGSESQLKSASAQGFDAAKRTLQNRPQSSKSPRSVTPPQARPLASSGNAQTKTERLLLGKKSPAHASAPARENPRSPDDRLIIDDGSIEAGLKQATRMRTPTPTASQPPPLTPSNSSSLNPYVHMSYLSPSLSLHPSDFSSPAGACDYDDALMDEAVSKVSPDDA